MSTIYIYQVSIYGEPQLYQNRVNMERPLLRKLHHAATLCTCVGTELRFTPPPGFLLRIFSSRSPITHRVLSAVENCNETSGVRTIIFSRPHTQLSHVAQIHVAHILAGVRLSARGYGQHTSSCAERQLLPAVYSRETTCSNA